MAEPAGVGQERGSVSPVDYVTSKPQLLAPLGPQPTEISNFSRQSKSLDLAAKCTVLSVIEIFKTPTCANNIFLFLKAPTSTLSKAGTTGRPRGQPAARRHRLDLCGPGYLHSQAFRAGEAEKT